MTVAEAGRLLRSGRLSCVALVEQTIADLEARERFHSFITPTFEAAREAATVLDKELAAGRDRGPFHGIPIAHKDNYYTRGVRTTGGSLLFREFVPDDDATVVARLREAGAISLGKANLHELAFGITSKNPHYGFVLNPRDTTRLAGGSSGGSAALVAAGLLPFATGSDTGGSIRIPASFCGIVGLKPTYGRVSRRGLLPLSFSLDCAGPLGTTVEDCRLGLEAMTGLRFAQSPGVDATKLRIGVATAAWERSTPAVADRVQVALGKITAELVAVELPNLDEMNAVARVIQLGETAALYAAANDATQFGADVWALVQQGKQIAAHEYVNAQRLRTLFRRRMAEIWKQVDVIAMPTTPTVAPLQTEDKVIIRGQSMDVRIATTSLVRCWNMTGEPAISLPCGQVDGLPVGLQLITAPFEEAKLLNVAQSVERLLG